MRPMRVLDLFCGAGGASQGYARAGFEVVGVDIRPQPHYVFGDEFFVQANALEYLRDHGSEFDLIHASPPCQRYSVGTARWDRSIHPDLISEVRQLLQETGKPYVIENVIGAPLRCPIMLCGTMFGLGVYRHRLFESNMLLFAPEHCKHKHGSTGAHRGYSRGQAMICVAGHNFDPVQAAEAMQIGWMNRDELAQAIPPAYTEFIGRQIAGMMR